MSQPMDLNTVTATVDDAELLTILGLSSLPSSPVMCNDRLAVLDWDDMPELSEEEGEEEEDDDSIVTNKRKHSDDDLFAEFDFVEVPLMEQAQDTEETDQKKRKLLQPSFVDDEDTLLNPNLNLQLDDDIQLALDLIAS
ncbi:hypothetical protein A0J61_07690 [Choanephora cucurbitarum]|uniref:Uncharacterized protein n=1 Tax=Choanephora cucurbitarum TaxID=101091 RepID=A0A1C7N554_9FUNG|nr:hypothetical protein A0J61_07690 [Choanephora cucurbitarum]